MEKIQSELRIGLHTSRTDSDARIFGFKVVWIPWNSGFRGTDLKLGDVITALEDKSFDPKTKDFDFASYSEEQFWAKRNAKDGDRVTLTVVRDGETRTIEGRVRAERYYMTSEGRKAVASPGPDSMARDGFDASWGWWDEALTKEMATAFEVGWKRNTQQQVEAMRQHADRIAFLVERYPGPYASAMKEDFQKALAFLQGNTYELTADDLAYRTLSATRAKEAAALAQRSWDEYVRASGAVSLASLPEVDPVRGDRTAAVGKLAILPNEMEQISEAGHGWIVAKGAGASIFLADQQAPAFVLILRAMLRFGQLIEPNINERFRLVGKIGQDPVMVAAGRKVYTGLTVEPVAALVDEKMFIDLAKGADAKFAGEAEAKKPPVVDTRPDLPPEEVFRAWVNALKLGSNDLWDSFFSSWACEPTGREPGEYVLVDDGGISVSTRFREWLRARAQILGQVYDVRVVKTSKPRVLLDKPDLKIEQVRLEVDHIGLIDGAYKAFKDVNVHREWKMQRMNGGPWRIVTERGI